MTPVQNEAYLTDNDPVSNWMKRHWPRAKQLRLTTNRNHSYLELLETVAKLSKQVLNQDRIDLGHM